LQYIYNIYNATLITKADILFNFSPLPYFSKICKLVKDSNYP